MKLHQLHPRFGKLFCITLFAITLISGLVYAAQPSFSSFGNAQSQHQSTPPVTDDTIRYAVKATAPVTEKDLDNKMSDLKDPDNLKTDVQYDEKQDTYTLGSKIGDNYLNTPFLLTPEEYHNWSLRKSMNAYYRKKNADDFKNKDKKLFDFTDMNFDLGPAEKIFGPGGVKIKTQGSAELKFGTNLRSVDNPSLPIRNRRTFGFDFDEKLNLSLQGSIGDKMNMPILHT